jgi:hypothetical protein
MNAEPTFYGDDTYSIRCTGDAVVGDEVAFERAVFSGSYKRPQFEGYELVKGRIISDSYGSERQQHTFTLLLEDGRKMRIKGRNLYKHGTWRKPWSDESKRLEALAEKHERGETARAMRDARRAIENPFF